MLVKFFARGKGKGRGPVEYITRKNHPGTNKLRYPAPEVVRGNPAITRQLIDSLEFKHKYNSGVLSFATSDAPTEKEINAVIDSFERYAFAGLEQDAYNTLWVKHTHTGNNRVELHFVTPRVELYTGKSLNIAPPGWHGYFKPWQSLWNIQQGWARPDDRNRKRDYEPGFIALINAERATKGLKPINDTKKLLTELVIERVTTGLITGRDDIIALFQELGLEINRAGKNYITVKDPETEKKYRLKGKLYEREFRPQPEITAETRQRTTTNSRVDSRELQAVTERIKRNYQSRTEYHRERYQVSKRSSNQNVGQILPETHRRGVEPLSGYLWRQLGDDAILVGADPSKAGNIGSSESGSRFSISEVTRATTDFGIAPEEDSRDNDYPDRQRNISDSTDRFDLDSWLAMPGSTLPETGVVNHERTRKQTNDRFRKAVTAIQAGHDELIPQVQHGHESARSAEQAATNSSDALEPSNQQLERANREALRIQQQIDRNLNRIRGILEKRRVKQLERFKTEINLVEFAMSLGYEYVREKSSHNKAVLFHESGDKIIVVTDKGSRGLYFSQKNNQDKGTIIDFLQHRSNFNLGTIRRHLRPWLRKRNCNNTTPKPQPISDERISLIQKTLDFSVLINHPCLAKLDISKSTLNNERFIGCIAVDRDNNVIILHYDHDGLTGYQTFNQDWKSLKKTGTKALWKSNSNKEDTRLVITKTAVDALSYHQLFPDEHTRYISTEGVLSSYQKELIKETIAEFSDASKNVIIALGNDDENKQLANILSSLAVNDSKVKFHRPKNANAQNWNESLRKQIERDRWLLQQEKEKSSQRSQLEP